MIEGVYRLEPNSRILMAYKASGKIVRKRMADRITEYVDACHCASVGNCPKRAAEWRMKAYNMEDALLREFGVDETQE